MASIYPKPRSPFWYLKYTDKDGISRNKSTGLRRDDPRDTEKARILRAEHEASEIQRGPRLRGRWDWVEPYLERKCKSPLTLIRYRTAWRWIHQWLVDGKLAPEDIRYAHASKYVDWRVGYKKHSGKRAGKNTAILEAKIFSMIMAEGVRLEHMGGNPWVSLEGMARDKAPKKRELTDAEIKQCREALKSEPEWMGICFEIGLYTGCRLRETVIPLSCIDQKADTPTMTFPTPKGGDSKAFSIPIPDGLMKLFRKLKAEAREVTLALPFQPSRHWSRFFHRIGLDDVTFHCLRVTRVTRLRRANVPRERAMRLVNHSSELIHMLYDRHQVADLVDSVNLGQVPPSGAGRRPNRSKQPFPRKKGSRSGSKSAGRRAKKSRPAVPTRSE